MTQNLSTQAKKLKKEFSLSDDDARELDRKIKASIEIKKHVTDREILECVDGTIKHFPNLTVTSELNAKINNIAGMYSENDTMFSMQNVWFGILAYWGTISTMIVDVICSESFIKYLSLSIIYLLLLVIFIFAVNKRNIHNLKLKYFLESFNDASTCTSLITSIFYCIGKLLADEISISNKYVDIFIIIFSVLYVAYITIKRYINCVKYILGETESLFTRNKEFQFYQKLKERLVISLNTSFWLMTIIMICIGLYPLLFGDTPNRFRCLLGILLLVVWFLTLPIINGDTKINVVSALIAGSVSCILIIFDVVYFANNKLDGSPFKDVIFCCLGIIAIAILIYVMLYTMSAIQRCIYNLFKFLHTKFCNDIPNFVSTIIAIILTLFILAIVIIVLLALTKNLIF